MTDPKYADLPGIARGEPDVYETKDLPESDQTSDFYEEENDSIERIHISATEAFNKFKGKNLSAGKVDFSERISRRIRTGYDAAIGEWEIVGQGEKETPLQKYQRLQCELTELLEEINKMHNEKKDETSNCLVSVEEIQQTLMKLADLQLEESLGQEVISSISDPQGVQLKKLMSQLEQFKAKANEQPESEGHLDDAIIYQFNYRPDQARLAQTARVAELETRIHRLEGVLGGSDEKLGRLSAATSKGTLLETAQYLSATASMLDSAQLDHIEGRLTALVQKLDMIAEKKAKISEDVEKDKMILELYELVKNTENVSKILPNTIERLKSLEAMHKKSGDFIKSLIQVEALQSEVQSNVRNNKALLKGVQESFALNLEEINKTIQNLDSRIKSISKK
ncbi:dynactin subunit 2 [Agrilus planipennis]|uniref:Dynactin subunit 2 n=1 Tax=Agrilus planipennis TaxID=224129 RepID=A0A1W4W8B9_AGRPL|nr:dynactin subunit 2 [Agrilus planipennis]XP_018320310.1 dynactin subunit 2 [Agrilus planipennis]XP_018320311.1 dynactin subunit 2 [Agrilus planipennis]